MYKDHILYLKKEMVRCLESWYHFEGVIKSKYYTKGLFKI